MIFNEWTKKSAPESNLLNGESRADSAPVSLDPMGDFHPYAVQGLPLTMHVVLVLWQDPESLEVAGWSQGGQGGPGP